MICILAGTYAEGREFSVSKGWLRRGDRVIIAVGDGDPARLRGYRFSRLEVVGSFWCRPHAEANYRAAMQRVTNPDLREHIRRARDRFLGRRRIETQ